MLNRTFKKQLLNGYITAPHPTIWRKWKPHRTALHCTAPYHSQQNKNRTGPHRVMSKIKKPHRLHRENPWKSCWARNRSDNERRQLVQCTLKFVQLTMPARLINSRSIGFAHIAEPLSRKLQRWTMRNKQYVRHRHQIPKILHSCVDVWENDSHRSTEYQYFEKMFV